MGKIWVQTTEGKLIHIPIVEDDFNTPDDPVKIPTSVVVGGVGRCFSEQRQIVHPTYGTITFDFMQDSGKTGSCNQCGQCCTHPVDDCLNPALCTWAYDVDIDAHACQYLVIDKKNKWPDPGNTSCSIYANILNVFKGCAYPPRNIHSWMFNCGYTVI